MSPNSSIGRRQQQDSIIVKDVKMPVVSPIIEDYIVSGEASCLDNDVPSSLRVNIALNKSVISQGSASNAKLNDRNLIQNSKI